MPAVFTCDGDGTETPCPKEVTHEVHWGETNINFWCDEHYEIWNPSKRREQ